MIFALILAVLAYSYIYQCGFVSDDLLQIPKGELPKKEWHRLLSYYLDKLWYKIAKKSKPGWHLIVLGYHLVAVMLFYKFCLVFFDREIALIASMLFAIHPCTNQGAVWVSGRHYTLGAIFTLLGMMLYKTVLLWPVLFLALGLHPQNWALIPFMALFGRSWAVVGAIIMGIAFIPFYLKWLKTRAKVFDWPIELTKWKAEKINMLIKMAAYYLYMALVPFRLGFYHTGMFKYTVGLNKFNLKVIFGGFALVSFFALALAVRKPMPELLFGICWFFMFLLPCMNIISNNMIFAERYMYIPLMGFTVAFAGVIRLLPNYPVILAVILTLYIIRTFSYTMGYTDNVKLFSVNLRNQPKSVEAHINLGDLYIKMGSPAIALPVLLRATELDPEEPIGWFNLGCAYANLSEALKARECWEKSLILNPKYVAPRYNLMRLDEAVKSQGGWDKLKQANWHELETVRK